MHKLGSTTSKVLVQEMKAIFAELGVPNIIVSDAGPQYTSAEFKDFTKQWQIEHRVSSPRNPQSNGIGRSRGGMPSTRPPYGTQFFHFCIHFHQKVPMSEVHAPPYRCTPPLWEILDLPLNGMAEHCVQTMKASLIKTIEEGKNVDLALLTYKTTPLNHRLPLPAELLSSRKYKTLLPICIVPTRLQESYRQIMDQGKQVQAQLYNKNTTELPRLKQSQKIIVQLDPHKNIWTLAEIIQCPTNKGRSYSLKTIHGGIYTRNRIFIKLDLTEAGLPKPKPDSEPRMARPTRTIRKPDRFIKSK